MIKMYTTSWCPDCHAAKRALTSKGLEFEEINIEQDEQAAQNDAAPDRDPAECRLTLRHDQKACPMEM